MRTTDGFEDYGTHHGFDYYEEDEMKNPNLYLELPIQHVGGYLLVENNNIFLLENNESLFY